MGFRLHRVGRELDMVPLGFYPGLEVYKNSLAVDFSQKIILPGVAVAVYFAIDDSFRIDSVSPEVANEAAKALTY
jgi:hypothetical protein